MRKVHWVSESSDKKIGPVVASYSTVDSCPDSCELKNGGCYAWGLFYLKVLSSKIENQKIAIKSLANALSDKNPVAKIVRHRVAGDVVGDVPATMEECATVEQHGLINIGYTHNWRAEEAQPLKKHFRASCNSLEDVKEAVAMGWSTTLVAAGNVPKTTTLEGKRAVICPARHGVEGKKDITCNDCTMCKVSDKTKDIVVMFKIHGNPATIKKSQGKVHIF